MRAIIVLAALQLVAMCWRAEACSLPGFDVDRLLRGPAEGRAMPADRPRPSAGPRRHGAASGRQREGQSYQARAGSPVTAPTAGIVTSAGRAGVLGNVVEIAHGNGYATLYAHLERTLVAQGECVEPGTAVGTVGCTGLCAVPHLYFELSRLGEKVDPAPFLRAPAPSSEIPGAWLLVDREKLLDAVVATVESEFLDRELLARIGWSAAATARRQSIADAPSAAAAVGEINGLLTELRTSHTRLYTPDDYEYYILQDINGSPKTRPDGPAANQIPDLQPRYPGIGVFTQEVGGRDFVDGVLEGSDADKAGLKFGDEILSVNGRPYSPIAAFRDLIGKSARLEVRRRPGAEPEIVMVPVSWIEPAAAFDAATEASARVIDKGAKRIGYAHIWAFKDSRGLERALHRIAMSRPPVDYLIVDARAKVGGLSTIVQRNLELLDKDPEPYWGRWTTGDRAAWHPAYQGAADQEEARGRRREVLRQRPDYRGRAALLIDHHTRSAGEIMAYAFKRSGFGPVFGTTTAGAVVSGVTYLMPGGLLLYLAKVGHYFDEKPLEGSGVAADHYVERPLAYAGGADPVLDAALEALAGASQ